MQCFQRALSRAQCKLKELAFFVAEAFFSFSYPWPLSLRAALAAALRGSSVTAFTLSWCSYQPLAVGLQHVIYEAAEALQTSNSGLLGVPCHSLKHSTAMKDCQQAR